MFRKTLQVFNIALTARNLTGHTLIRLLCLLFYCAAINVADAADNNGSDVRLVIDISGSMKKNDPQNLRVPAVKLLTNLMPSGSQAGIWTFGQYVNNLLPVKTIDAAWQQQANAAASQINSLGAFTNIPDALNKAMDGWDSASTKPRHIILLTDGVVDVSKDATENIKARQHLLDDVLPKLKAAQAHVHTIALSREADAELLGKIARETDALFEMVESAEALNKVFLRIFEQSAPRDTVPLTDNKFTIDNAIEEFTVLVFKSDTRPVQLITPEGKKFAKEQALEGWRWYSDSRYDLITLTKPAAGVWGLDANIDPDNRVMIVSKLALKIDELPRVMMPGEQLQFVATLLDDKKPVTKREFLDLVKASAQIKNADSSSSLDLISDNAGRFSAPWTAPEQASNATINIVVQSPTFVRSRQFSVQVAQGSISLHRAEHEDKASQFEIKWNAEAFDKSGLSFTAKLWHDGKDESVAVSEEKDKRMIKVMHEAAGKYHLEVEAKGKSVSGRDVVLQAKSEEWQVESAEPVVETHHEEAAPEHHEAAKAEHEAEAKHDEVKPEPAHQDSASEDEHGWLFWTIVAVSVNAVLLLIGGGIWWLVKRKQKSATADIEKALGD